MYVVDAGPFVKPEQRGSEMNVKEIMANVVHMVDGAQPLEKVASIMKDNDIGCVVVGTRDKMEGVITDRDIVCRAVAAGNLSKAMTAADVMTSKPASCREDDTVKQAAVIMEKNQVRRLPVLGFDGCVVGIVSMGDIAMNAPHELAGELVEEVSRPEHRNLAETA